MGQQPFVKNNIEIASDFARDTFQGLSAVPKYLKSKYFYDSEGDKLFQKIMALNEYYLTDCESEILNHQKDELMNFFRDSNTPFLLTELGAGDGQKTEILLHHFFNESVHFQYLPIDISSNVLNLLESKLSADFPGLKVKTYAGDYFQALDRLNKEENGRKVLLFLGSTIGNFEHREAVKFLQSLNKRMDDHDQLIIGFDLKKDPNVILRAYNDPSGFTAKFNLNLLHRINRELEGEFVTDNFYHQPTYDPSTGEAKSFLVSKIDQNVHIGKLNTTFGFKRGESIFTEISQKYDEVMIHNLAEKSGFQVKQIFYDSKKYFVDSLWQKSKKSIV
ncbi:MAG: L-histidine N(alpha)-methyltransferase [Bacteroidales bacterium]|nr:L-histidine N(alpha)-methyltransferase [Bacteroidales bacterium]